MGLESQIRSHWLVLFAEAPAENVEITANSDFFCTLIYKCLAKRQNKVQFSGREKVSRRRIQQPGEKMRFFPLAIAFILICSIRPALPEATDFFHEKIDTIASRFTSLDIPDLEKIQLPQIQSDGSYIFIYVWFPKTHKPTKSSFEANVGDYFDIVGSQQKVFSGWCYTKKPESHTLRTETGEVGVMRIWALGFHGRAPRSKCRGGVPGEAGRLGQTQVFKDPSSGLLSMVRSGHPTRFPPVQDVRSD
jgi:hypothetical protein